MNKPTVHKDVYESSATRRRMNRSLTTRVKRFLGSQGNFAVSWLRTIGVSAIVLGACLLLGAMSLFLKALPGFMAEDLDRAGVVATLGLHSLWAGVSCLILAKVLRDPSKRTRRRWWCAVACLSFMLPCVILGCPLEVPRNSIESWLNLVYIVGLPIYGIPLILLILEKQPVRNNDRELTGTGPCAN